MKDSRKQQVFAPIDLPAGTHVRVLKDDGEQVCTRTTSKPWQLGDGTWVVKMIGWAGGYDLGRVRAWDLDDPCKPHTPPADQLDIDDNDGSPRAVEASRERSNLTPPEPSDAEAIDRIAAYLRRNGYAEVTIWENGGAVYRQDHLHDALAQAERERDRWKSKVDAAVEAEAARWQERLDDIIAEVRPQQDGSGTDTGDPLDVTAAELHQAVEYLRERSSAALRNYNCVVPLANAYHTIRETLGMDADTDPQEVVDAVGRVVNAVKQTIDELSDGTTPQGERLIDYVCGCSEAGDDGQAVQCGVCALNAAIAVRKG